MAFYVDDMRRKFGRMVMCHFLADTPEELHIMAERAGCKRKWFQVDHYDVPLFRRARLVELGAKEITQREAVVIRRNFRKANCDILAS